MTIDSSRPPVESAASAPGAQPPLAEVAAFLEQHEAEASRRSLLGAAALGVVAVGTAVGFAWMHKNGGALQVSHPLPFIEKAQEVVNGVDGKLVPIGEVGLPVAVTFLAAVKAAAPLNLKARFANRFSSREPSGDGRGERHRPVWRRKVGIAMAGAALATFTSGIATAVSDGPSAPIEAMHQLVPGDSIVVQDANAMPMVQSSLNPELTQRVRQAAAKQGVATHAYDMNLGTYVYGANKPRTDLIFGIETPRTSPLQQDPADCTDIPLVVDKTAGIPKGASLTVNGATARVVGLSAEHISSLNRIGMVADLAVLEACIEQTPGGPVYGVALETDTATAQTFLDTAQKELKQPAPAVVITPEQEIKNSEAFWEANVKPITNVLSLAAGGVALLAMTGSMASRLLRNRRELAAKLAAGVTPNTLRLAEMVRSTKDGVIAAVGGVALGAPIAVAASSLESGFKVGVGFREAMIGTAVALLGSVGGGLLSLVRLKRVANPKDNTRV